MLFPLRQPVNAPFRHYRWLRLHQKNGKPNEMPCHHKLEEYLDAYIRVTEFHRPISNLILDTRPVPDWHGWTRVS